MLPAALHCTNHPKPRERIQDFLAEQLTLIKATPF
jgi:hypothetical protein